MQNQTLPLNFDNNHSKLIEDGDGDVSLATVKVPMMEKSAMSSANATANQNTKQNLSQSLIDASPLKKSQTLRLVKVSSKDDETISQGNRSTTTQGGRLANKIGQAVSRICSQTFN